MPSYYAADTYHPITRPKIKKAVGTMAITSAVMETALGHPLNRRVPKNAIPATANPTIGAQQRSSEATDKNLNTNDGE